MISHLERVVIAAALIVCCSALNESDGNGTHFVYPDVHWNDTDGNRIEAHAAVSFMTTGMHTTYSHTHTFSYSGHAAV
jgi:hypothetical protein